MTQLRKVRHTGEGVALPTKRICAKDSSPLELLAASGSDDCGYWCPSCESFYEEDNMNVITDEDKTETKRQRIEASRR